MCYGQEISNALRRARKEHVCDWCEELIEPKTKYFAWFGIVYSDPVSTKLHPECVNATKEFFAVYPDECWMIPAGQPRGKFDPEVL